MKKILLVLLFVYGYVNSMAQIWKPQTANISFKIKMLGATVQGKFSGLVGSIKFDPNDLANASIVATVDAATIDTDNNLRNKHLREKEDFFDVAKYPTIKMKTLKIEKEGNNYIGYFNLTMKAATKQIKLPFVFYQEGNKATFQGSTVINRRDWKVGGGTWGMSDDVTFSIVLNAIREIEE
jgi:polyisoprenoid-binding protein YceI